MILAFFVRYPGRAPNVFSCKIQHHEITFNCRQCHGKPGVDKKKIQLTGEIYVREPKF